MAASSSQRCVREVLDGVPPIMWFMRRQMRQHRGQLSLPQFRVLVRLSREPAASLSAVAEHLGTSLPTVSRLIGTMVSRGLLARARGADGDDRRIALTITPRGQAVLDLAREQTQQQMRRKLAALSAEQEATVIEAMSLLKGVFGAFNDPTAPPEEGAASPAQPAAAE